MGKDFPTYPADVSDGDETSFAPTKNEKALLGTERSTDSTRRLETDAERNLYVHVAKDSSSAGVGAGVLNSGAITSVPVSTLSTIVTYVAPSTKGVVRISCSGTVYAKYRLVLNTTTIEIKRSGPDYTIEFGAFALATTDTLDVKVEHFYTGQTEDFESTIYGV